MAKQAQNRDDRNGQYDFTGGLDRLCVCGHTLGQHAAGTPHECFTHTYATDRPEYADCDCPKFRPSRRKQPA